MTDTPVVVSVAAAVATITLNRPHKRNALNAAMVAGLKAAVAELGPEPEVRVIVLTGAGSDFCAGADLEQLDALAATADPLANLRDAQSLGELFVQMRNAPKPIVAAVRGSAIAGGAGIAGACDLVLAADDAVFGYPEVHLGFVPAMVMALLRRTVGEKHAFELVARGDRIAAGEAYRLGLVNRVLPEPISRPACRRTPANWRPAPHRHSCSRNDCSTAWMASPSKPPSPAVPRSMPSPAPPTTAAQACADSSTDSNDDFPAGPHTTRRRPRARIQDAVLRVRCSVRRRRHRHGAGVAHLSRAPVPGRRCRPARARPPLRRAARRLNSAAPAAP
jgi:methylglutaconyl-CoA hydratase